MKKIIKELFLSFLLLQLYFINNVFPININNHKKDPDYNISLLIIWLKINKIHEDAVKNIYSINEDLKKNDKQIDKLLHIIKTSSEKNDEDSRIANNVAQQTLIKAYENKKKLMELKNQEEFIINRSENIKKNIELYLKNNKNININGTIVSKNGEIKFQNYNNEYQTNNEILFIKNQSFIETYDGTVQLSMMNGRADLKIEPYTKLLIQKDSMYQTIINLENGEIYINIDNINDYTKWIDNEIIKNKKFINKFLNKHNKNNIKDLIIEEVKKHKFKVRTQGAVFGVRGTKFSIKILEENITKVRLEEGELILTLLQSNENVLIKSKSIVLIYPDGRYIFENEK